MTLLTRRLVAGLIAGFVLQLPNLVNAATLQLEGMQSIGNTRHHRVHAESLSRDYHLLVSLPADYDAEEAARLPVIYLLDGGATFPMLAGYYRYLRLQEDVPDAILVGISYGADNFEDGNFRSTDYTAPTSEREWWGGAEQFQTVLGEQILPLIESQYRADAGRRVLFGQSIAGQFVLFSAMTAPEMFRGRVASNPALHRNLEFFIEPGPEAAAPLPLLFVASASNDEQRFRQPAVAWIDHWQGVDERPWRLLAESIDGYGHFSLITESFRRGLTWYFENE